jgi:hypothetical protein
VATTVYNVVVAGLATGLVHEVQDSPVPGDQTYDTPPDGNNVVEEPAHKLTFGPASVGRVMLTPILTVSVLRQPFASVPVTVYTVVTVGEASGLAHAVQDSPDPGDHVYVTPPEALSSVPEPRHIVVGALARIAGKGLTVTLTVSVFMQPLAPIPVRVYTVVVAGLAVGLAHVVQESPVAGDHE